jgi:transcriptional regulator with PAS, ATPase and Fis domain
MHAASARSAKPFVAINCSALSRELLESELFGYRAGAFTGANKDKKGLLEEAEGGTLFLDEIGDMPAELQTKMLRVLENRSYIKVGDTAERKTNVRVIAATHRDLSKDVTEGRFREDLYYRLNVFTIHLPALRERQKDIPELALYFLQQFAAKSNPKVKSMSAAFTAKLQQYAWPGNIRELKNTMERSVLLANESVLDLHDLPADLQSAESTDAGSFTLAEAEKQHIRKILRHTGGNKAEAARLLNIGIATLYRKIEEYKLG